MISIVHANALPSSFVLTGHRYFRYDGFSPEPETVKGNNRLASFADASYHPSKFGLNQASACSTLTPRRLA